MSDFTVVNLTSKDKATSIGLAYAQTVQFAIANDVQFFYWWNDAVEANRYVAEEICNTNINMEKETFDIEYFL